MRRETSAGVLLFQDRPLRSFLVLLRHDGTPDLPKGHLKRGENELAAALRELEEETALRADGVRIDTGFSFSTSYSTRSRKTGEPMEKTVHVFLGALDGPAHVEVSDHADYAWIPWTDLDEVTRHVELNPTIVGAVRALAVYEAARGRGDQRRHR